MKSAYERAMEKLNAESPTRQLSDEEKAEISDIETKAAAQIAEARLNFDGKLASATSQAEAQELKEQMLADVARIEERRDSAKDEIWNRGT
jgi:hypothetical protein